jgi:hypothetical protein
VKLQCAQEVLADALATACRIVPTKSTLPVATNVLLEADPADGLRVVATNLELTLSQRVRATVATAGRTTAPARLLADVNGQPHVATGGQRVSPRVAKVVPTGGQQMSPPAVAAQVCGDHLLGSSASKRATRPSARARASLRAERLARRDDHDRVMKEAVEERSRGRLNG